MKKLLLLVLVLFMGGCHTCYTEPEPPVDEPTIGPQLKLKDPNPTETWLKGTWKYSLIDSTIEFKFTDELGKQQLSYDDPGKLSSVLSYEIIENYFTDTDNQTHLLVYYTDANNTERDKQKLYKEIENIGEDEYRLYTRGYSKGAQEGNPQNTGRASLNGTPISFIMKRVK